MPTYTITELCEKQHTAVMTLAFDPVGTSSRISSLPLKGVYTTAQRPQHKELEPNRWILILKTDTSHVRLELRPSDPIGNTITVCSEVNYIFAESDVKSFFIPVKEGRVVGDVLHILSSTGTTRYKLQHNGKGKSPSPLLTASSNAFLKADL